MDRFATFIFGPHGELCLTAEGPDGGLPTQKYQFESREVIMARFRQLGFAADRFVAMALTGDDDDICLVVDDAEYDMVSRAMTTVWLHSGTVSKEIN